MYVVCNIILVQLLNLKVLFLTYFLYMFDIMSQFIRSGSKSIKAKRNNLQSVQFSVLCIYIYNLLASAKTTMLSLNTPRATRGTERTANTYINCTLTIASW